MNFLNGLVQTTCVSLDSEPLALALDVERQHLYWMTFDTVENTVMLSQMNYNSTHCGTRCFLSVFIALALMCRVF